MIETDREDLTELGRTNRIKAEMGLVLSPLGAMTLLMLSHQQYAGFTNSGLFELIDLGLAQIVPNDGPWTILDSESRLTEEGKRHIQKMLRLPIGDIP